MKPTVKPSTQQGKPSSQQQDALSDASSAFDEEEDRSDGDSIDGDAQYESAVVSRIYRPSTVSDHSAYSVALSSKYARAPGGAEKPTSSKVLDYGQYTKTESRAEFAQATAAANAPSPMAARHETVSEATKKMYDAAYARPSSATAKTPAIDFGSLKPTASEVASSYDYSAWGGVASHHSARVGAARYDGVAMAPDMATNVNRNTERHHQRNHTSKSSSHASNPPPNTDASPPPPTVAERRAAAQRAEVERLKQELAETVDDPEHQEYLRMMLSLQKDVARDLELQQQKTSGTAQPVATTTTDDAPTSPTKPRFVDPERQREHDDRVTQVSAAVADMRAGRPFNARVLEDVPVFDFAAAAVLSHRVDHAAEAEAVRNATRRFYTAVAVIEDLVAGDELTGLVSGLLERYRRQFQASKPLRERGEYAHADHEAFRHFASVAEQYIFSHVTRAVGPDFDVEEFFEKVFEEEDLEEERNSSVTATGDAAADRLRGKASSYPVLSSEAWEMLLAVMNFESFTDLMDHFIFTHNAAAGASSTASTAAAPPTSSATSAAAPPVGPSRAAPFVAGSTAARTTAATGLPAASSKLAPMPKPPRR